MKDSYKMKALLATVLLNLGWRISAWQGDVLIEAAQRNTKVNAAIQTCGPTV